MRLSILPVALAMGLLGSPAFAADLGAVEPLPLPPAPVAAAPANDWTGFYLGALGGYSWGRADTDSPDGEIDVDGFDVGGYAGANWQWGNFVVGGEADLLFPFSDGSGPNIDAEQGLNGSLRARAGIALDRFLVYGTGGVAGTELELDRLGGSDSQALWGWTAGVGGEAMVTDNITARVEYRYSDYEDETFDLGGGAVDSDFTTHSIRGGVGLKF
jgi:outer membrane immunogenic protein